MALARRLRLGYVAKTLAGGRTPSKGHWLAGYYLNDALFRIESLVGKLEAYTKGQRVKFPKAVGKIFEDVQRIKKAPSGVLGDRKTKYADAVEVLSGLSAVMADAFKRKGA